MNNIKITFFVLILTSVFCSNIAAQNYHYYYNDESVNLNINSQKFFIYADLTKTTTRILRATYNIEEMFMSETPNIVCFRANISNNNYNDVLRQLYDFSYVIAVEPVIGDSNYVNTTRRFYVKLLSDADYILLSNLAYETKTSIVGQVPHCRNWYALQVDKLSAGNSIEVSNIFYELVLVAAVDPGFAFRAQQNSSSSCVQDLGFDKQWEMNVIKACKAWKLTTGDTNIRVAVIDGGIDTSHVEFDSLNVVFSYDVTNNTSPAGVYRKPHIRDNSHPEPEEDFYHGIHVGGIIFANHNRDSVAG